MFPGWEVSDDQIDSLFNFKWKPVSNGINFDIVGKHGLKQVINHVQGHHELTTKDNLFLNLKSHYENSLVDCALFDDVPLTFVLDYMNETISDKMQEFRSVHKMFKKVISKGKTEEQDVSIINEKLMKMSKLKRKMKTLYKINPCCHSK